jgi:hypothetical protein
MAHFFIPLCISTIWTFLMPINLTELHSNEYSFIVPTILLHSEFSVVLTYFILLLLHCFEKQKQITKSIMIVIIALPLQASAGLEGGWSVPRPGCFTPRKDPVPIVQEAGWAPGPVWTCVKNLTATGIRSPDRPARSQSLYRLSYQAHRE